MGAPKALFGGRREGGVYLCRVVNGSQCNRIDKFNFRNSM